MERKWAIEEWSGLTLSQEARDRAMLKLKKASIYGDTKRHRKLCRLVVAQGNLLFKSFTSQEAA